ncbi:hypothetical protein D9611_000468 [Ephemerocybe angulata]|uniref:Short-chain dehydrogenase n=1 Tax=Ephemerocybe angulata TaxID=980116 RepID=A0A8H5BMB3_9AGAR|nr:hypothetical protein D9611_000468 [Tulosesus angulatus]
MHVGTLTGLFPSIYATFISTIETAIQNGMKQTFFQLLSGQLRTVPPVVTADLSGKTVVVTGSNGGLGLEAAKHFARMKPGKLILAVRSESRGKAAADHRALKLPTIAEIKNETGFDAVEVWLLDQSRFSSVIAFADRFEKEDLRLDILVANAAIIPATYRTTEDGWEESLQVNDLSPSLLCLLLVPRMVETGKKYNTKPRIVTVSSGIHYLAEFNESVYDADSSWQALSREEYFNPKFNSDQRYFETKLLNVFFTRSLNSLVKDTPIIVNALSPGYCYSNIRRESKDGIVQAFVGWLMRKALAWTTEQGSRQLVYSAIGGSDNPDQLKGAYIDLHQVVEPTDHVIGFYGKQRGNKLWSDLVRELSKVDGRVGEIVRAYST